MKEKKISLFIFNFIAILYLELLFRVVAINHFFTSSLFNILISTLLFSTIIYLVCSVFKEKANRIIYRIILFITSFWALAMLVYKNIFNVFFSLAMFKLADQVMDFWKDALGLIAKNLLYIILLLIPFALSIILRKKIDFERKNRKKVFITLGIIILLVVIFKASLLINKNKTYSSYEIYYNINDQSLSIEKFGVYIAGYLDVKKELSDFQEKVSLVKTKKIEQKNIVYEYNNLDIDFDKLISNTSDSSIKQMHEYFNNETGTLQNEYTGMFEGKNLILFMAESFNEIAVSKELTPTLYKMVNSSFIFDNFYTPVNNSTIGGEFQELTGLFANNSILRTFRNGNNYFPFGLSTVYEDLGYKTYAYHDHYYTFQDRNKYLKALGFDNFKGCYSGLEKLINCKTWPESDVEMIKATFEDYANDDKFMVFYASVSGHGGYNWGNAQAAKHKSEVASLPYSEPVKAYIAAQMEFDKALELLLDKLEEKGILEDTVIAFVGDHYPYMLTLDQVNEAATYKKDEVIEINRSNFALYNTGVKNTHISKIGSEIDVLPTIYNLFGIKYDSRLIIGKDILSTEPGLAIFNNRSWVSDYGKYFASSKTFVPKEGVDIPEGYVDTMNKIVSNKINMSKLIIEKDYYRKALGK